MIEINKIQKYYNHKKIHILKGVSVQIDLGSTCSIMGPSGSGKSTLLSLIGGLDHYEEGSLKVNGHEIGELSESELTQFRATNLGIVFQQFHLIEFLTALENVMLPLEINKESDCEEKAKKMLERVGLAHREKHLPSELSGGECQRVAIARALINQPKIILADEPSGNLDVETGNAVMDLFFNLIEKENLTLVIVTHNPSIANRCQKKLQLKEGVLVND